MNQLFDPVEADLTEPPIIKNRWPILNGYAFTAIGAAMSTSDFNLGSLRSRSRV